MCPKKDGASVNVKLGRSFTNRFNSIGKALKEYMDRYAPPDGGKSE